MKINNSIFLNKNINSGLDQNRALNKNTNQESQIKVANNIENSTDIFTFNANRIQGSSGKRVENGNMNLQNESHTNTTESSLNFDKIELSSSKSERRQSVLDFNSLKKELINGISSASEPANTTKFREIKSRIQNNQYNVDPRKIARNILESTTL